MWGARPGRYSRILVSDPVDEARTAQDRLERVAQAQVDLVYQNAPSGFVATAVVGVLIVVATWDAIGHVALEVWLAATVGIGAVRFAGVRAYQRRAAGASLARWRNLFTAGALAAGLGWGALGSVLFPAASPVHQMVIGFALGGMVAGGAAYLAPVRASYVAYAASAVLPFSARLIATGELSQVSMGVMTVAFVASMIATSRSMHATITDNIVLRIDKEDVAARLVVEQERIAQQAEELQQRARELALAHEASLAGTRTKSAFLATMSHEIRTPLNAIIGMADLVEQTALSDEQREYVSTIHSSGESLLALLSDILDFSKLEAGKVEIDELAFDLPRCIEETIDAVAPAAAKKRLELLWELSERTPARVRSDPTRLRQILLNLLSNAVKFTATGDITVTVDARPLPGGAGDDVELEIAVRDQGFGIPADKLGRLFQSFSQVDASTTRHFGGTGLGLAICQALVSMLGGHIGVVSEPGKGSTFTFTVRAKSLGQAPDDEASSSARALVRGARVAVFGSHEGIRAQLQRWLERWGVQVSSQEPCDVALLDLGATADGLASVARLRERGVRAPIIALVPLGQTSASAGDLARSGVATVSKPLKPSRLLRAVSRALSRDATPGPLSYDPRRASSPSLSPRGLRVLVAEDNEVNQLVERRMLEQLGHTVDVVDNGLRAIEALRAGRYDVVLLDMQMPELDGLSTAAQIVETWPRPERPRLVALTANAMSGDRERCLAAGMDDYVTKPIRRDALEAALRGPSAGGRPAASGPSPTTQGGLLDRAIIEDLRGLEVHAGQSVLRDMVEIFLREAPELIASIDRLLGTGDLAAAGRAAHKLKGSAATLGVLRVALVASSVEDAASSGDLEATGRLAKPLAAALDAVEPALRRLASSSSSATHRRVEGAP